MGRPRKTGLLFFPHDVGLSSDLKIQALEASFGYEGYGVYMKLLERIYEAGSSPDMNDENVRGALAYSFHLEPSRFMAVVTGCVTAKLFEAEPFSNGELTSNGIRERLDYVGQIRKRERDKKEAWKAKKKNEEARPAPAVDKPIVFSLGNTPGESGISPVKGAQTETETETETYKENSNTSASASPPPTATTASTALVVPKAKKVAKAKEPTDSLYQPLKEAFLMVAGDFTSWPKEGAALKGICEKIRRRCARTTERPEDVANALLSTLLRLKGSGDKFWRGQPFVPSTLNASGIFDRVAEEYGVVKEADWDWYKKFEGQVAMEATDE